MVTYSGWSPFTRKLVIILLLIAVVAILWMLRTVTTALLLSAFIAFLISPVVKVLHERARIPRLLGGVLVLLAILALISLIVVILTPIIVDQFSDIRFSLEESIDGFLAWLRDFLDNFRTVFGYDLNSNIDNVQDRLRVENIESWLSDSDFLGDEDGGLLRAGTGALASVLTTVGGFLFTFALILVFTTYLVNDVPVLSRAVSDLIPPEEKPDLEDLKQRLRGVWFAFVRGNLLLMAALGFLVGVSMYAVGLPSALLLGIIAGLLAIIPTIGAFIAGALMVGMALVQGSNWLPLNNFLFALVVLGIYLVLQWVEGNILQPKIMGSAVNLPGFVAIVGIVVGLAVGGILGAYLAIPLIASVREIFLYVFRKLQASQEAQRVQLVSAEAAAAGGSGPRVSVASGALGGYAGGRGMSGRESEAPTDSSFSYETAPEPPAGLLLPETSYVSLDEIHLRVLRWEGAGMPLLCLHGLTSNAYAFGGFAYAMRGARPLIAHDLRGRGDSAKPDGPYGLVQHARDAVDLMDSLGVDEVAVVGHSYGAHVALVLAAMHPDRIRHAVFIDGGGPLPSDTMADLRADVKDIDEAASSFAEYVGPIKGSGVFEGWNYFIERFYRENILGGPDGVRARASKAAVMADLEDMEGFDFEQYVSRLTAPSLVLQAGKGMGDTGRPVLTEEHGRRMASASPRGTFISFPKATHSSILYNRYGEIAVEVERFIESTSTDPSESNVENTSR